MCRNCLVFVFVFVFLYLGCLISCWCGGDGVHYNEKNGRGVGQDKSVLLVFLCGPFILPLRRYLVRIYHSKSTYVARRSGDDGFTCFCSCMTRTHFVCSHVCLLAGGVMLLACLAAAAATDDAHVW